MFRTRSSATLLPNSCRHLDLGKLERRSSYAMECLRSRANSRWWNFSLGRDTGCFIRGIEERGRVAGSSWKNLPTRHSGRDWGTVERVQRACVWAAVSRVAGGSVCDWGKFWRGGGDPFVARPTRQEGDCELPGGGLGNSSARGEERNFECQLLRIYSGSVRGRDIGCPREIGRNCVGVSSITLPIMRGKSLLQR